MSIRIRLEFVGFDMLQGLHVICECIAGLLKLEKIAHIVYFEMVMHFQDKCCCSDVVVIWSLLGPGDSHLVAFSNLGAQHGRIPLPFESSLFPGARSILIFDGFLPRDFGCTDWFARLEGQQ